MTEGTDKVTRFGMNQIIPIVAALFAVSFFVLGLAKYGFWHPSKGPLPGFIPVIISTALFLVSIFAFIFSFSDAAPSWPKENWLVALSVVLIVGSTFLIGMILSLAVYLLVWLKIYEKFSWKTTLITSAVVMAIVIGCFAFWLGVPFPKGLLFDAILG